MINREWWLNMADKANYRWNNYAFQMYYMDVEEYCKKRADQSNKRI